MGSFLLVVAGGTPLALPLARVRELVDPSQVSGVTGGEAGEVRRVRVRNEEMPLLQLCAGPPAKGSAGSVGLAVIHENDLTAALYIDKIQGLRDERAVSVAPVPARIAAHCRFLEGLLEADGELFLLVDARRALGEEDDGSASRARQTEEGSRT